MDDLRVVLYLIAAGLFDRPEANRTDCLDTLIAGVLSTGPKDACWFDLLALLRPLLRCDFQVNAEYTHLFVVGPRRVAAQPFGSYWLEQDRALMGASALEVRAMMDYHGLGENQPSGRMPDHIISELEFMAYLAADHQATRRTQAKLLRGHLLQWTPKFARALRRAMPSERYRLTADFLDQLLRWDWDYLRGAPNRTKERIALPPVLAPGVAQENA